MTFDSRWAQFVVTTILLALLAWAYWPGLYGPFLFDDFGNLDVLGAYGGLHSWRDLLFYATSGNADPTGRPIALLSFLLDAQAWPAAAFPFKRTNLILHLLNTGLLAWVVAELQYALQARRPNLRCSAWTPLFAAGLWGAHPFFVSTTLYVIQREAMLPMAFLLIAMLAWRRTVTAMEAGSSLAGWTWAGLGFGGATLLAGCSKSNGFLAPLLVGLAYIWFLRPAQPSTHRTKLDRAAWLCLGVPSVALLAYVVFQGLNLWSLPLPARDWSLPQRLLSEPRALWTYIAHLILPRSGGGGVFVDNFVPSRGWLVPTTTAPAAIALAFSAMGAVVLRRRFPIASFAWLFFLCGNLLESSTIPLELYFEHRTYLPAMFLGWPVAHALLRPGLYPRYRAAFIGLLLATLLLLTHQRAQVWGDPALLGALAASSEAASPRAQANAARLQVEQGDALGGLQRILSTQRAQPGSVDIAVTAIAMECATVHAVWPETYARARHTLATARSWNFGLYEWLQDASRDASVRNCRGFGLPGLGALVSAAETNPQNGAMRRKRDLWHVRGRIALAQGRPRLALLWFDAALLAQPDPDYALVQAAALGDAGAPALGVAHLVYYDSIRAHQAATPIRDMPGIHRWLLRRYGYYDHELTYLREQLQHDADHQVTLHQK